MVQNHTNMPHCSWHQAFDIGRAIRPCNIWRDSTLNGVLSLPLDSHQALMQKTAFCNVANGLHKALNTGIMVN